MLLPIYERLTDWFDAWLMREMLAGLKIARGEVQAAAYVKMGEDSPPTAERMHTSMMTVLKRLRKNSSEIAVSSSYC